MRKFALVLVAALAVARPAFAQETPDAAAQDAPELMDLDLSRVDLDAVTRIPQSGHALRAPSSSEAESWNHSENRNGSANVALKRAWSNGFATQVGVDSVGAQQGSTLPGAAQPPGSGTGWARAAIPGLGPIDQATLDARLDPESDQRRFGARFEKSVPLNPQLSVTLQNGYGLSQPLVSQSNPGAAPPAQVLDIEQLAKLNVLNFGTSLFAGSRQSSAEDRRLNSFGAEQNLSGGISVSGAVSENAAGGHDRSLTARFRRSW